MCGPMIALAAGTAIFGAYSAIQQGNYQKGVSEYNARVQRNEAQQARNVGVERENMQRQQTAELVSKQRAQLGAAGVDIGSGSALQLQQDTLSLGEADALRIRSNFEGRADALNTQAGLTEAQGAAAQSAGATKAFSSLLGGATTIAASGVADKWFTPDSAASQDLLAGTPSGTGINPLAGYA